MSAASTETGTSALHPTLGAAVSGRRSKAIGKEGEREAKRLLLALGCQVAFTEVQGLAGDDMFILAPNGKWYSVEVKNTTSYNKDFLVQAKRQARERYDAIQELLSSPQKGLYEAMGLHTFDPDSYFVMWHPRNARIAMDSWSVYVSINGRVRCRHLDGEEGVWSLA